MHGQRDGDAGRHARHLAAVGEGADARGRALIDYGIHV
jgi:hypothetical protein